MRCKSASCTWPPMRRGRGVSPKHRCEPVPDRAGDHRGEEQRHARDDDHAARAELDRIARADPHLEFARDPKPSSPDARQNPTVSQNICRMLRDTLAAAAAGTMSRALMSRAPTAWIDRFTTSASRMMNR